MPQERLPPWNVLVFPAVTEIGLEIHSALRDSKEVILHGATLAGPNLATFHYKQLHTLPFISDPTCLAKLQQLIAQHKIDAIFPAHDDVVVWLAKHTNQLKATVITSPLESCLICRSKSKTYEALAKAITVPQFFKEDTITFPVFVKPDIGQGSQRARSIDNAADLRYALASEHDLIIMENLTGIEFTVDCFSSRTQGLLFAQPRERQLTRSGIATLTRPASSDAFAFVKDWAKRITQHIPLYGAWFFQVKAGEDGRFRLLEVAPRIAGSMALHRAMGINFPLLSLYEAGGYPIALDYFPSYLQMGRSLDSRFIYDQPIEALYLDLDDTLILRDVVNTRLVALIFQCRNRGIPVKLVSRHAGDINQRLKNFRLTELFDAVFHLTQGETKASIITEKYAVLIDDSFRERQQTARIKNIRCFESAATRCLIDERA